MSGLTGCQRSVGWAARSFGKARSVALRGEQNFALLGGLPGGERDGDDEVVMLGLCARGSRAREFAEERFRLAQVRGDFGSGANCELR